ncbi:MAG: pseudouridine synthase [Patescibacteria group bacterium]
MRIQKYLSERKILSRREATDYIKRGLIKLNGKVTRETGIQIDPQKDRVEILPAAKSLMGEKITVAVYKPRGIVSSKIKSEGKTIFELLPEFKDLNTVGRMDKDSEGLILLSNDGTITNAVTSDKHIIEKEYEVGVREDATPFKLRKMAQGILLEDGMTLPAKTRSLGQHKFIIILKEGRKHQIRRMASAMQLTTISLKRIRIGNINLGNLKSGKHRPLTQEEISKLKQKSP